MTSKPTPLGRWVLCLGILGTAGVLLFTLSQAAHYDLAGRGWLIYYGLPVALLLLLMGVVWRGSALAQNRVALALGIGGASLLTLELALPVVTRFSLVERGVEHSVDERSMRQVIAELRGQGQAAYPVMLPRVFYGHPLELAGGDRVLPLAGVANALTVMAPRDSEDGQYVFYESDSIGFRNPFSTHDGSEIEIALLGDSFALGVCVPDGNTAADVVRGVYPRTLNLGSAGSGPLVYLATLVEYASAYRPKIVFWLHFEGNDFHDLGSEANSPLRAYLEATYRQDLFERGEEVDRALREYLDGALTVEEGQMPLYAERTSKRSLRHRALSALKFETLRSRLGLVAGKPQDLEVFSQVLARASETVNSWEGRLVFVYLPENARFSRRPYPDSARRITRALAEEEGLEWLDVGESFQRDADPLRFFANRSGMHYSSAGYEHLGQALLSVMSREPE